MRRKSFVITTVVAAMFSGAAVVAQDTPPPAAGGPTATVEEKDAGESWYVNVTAFPTTLDEFRAMRDSLCTRPEGAMACFVIAMQVWSTNEDLGLQCLALILDKSLLGETINMRPAFHRPGVEGWQIGGEFMELMGSAGFQRSKAFAARTYVLGTTKDNGYALPPAPYRYYVRKHKTPAREGEWRGFLNTTGNEAGGAYPFIMKVNSRGVWKMLQASSFFVGYVPPPKDDDDGL
jgi:hypothetical protein